MWYARDPSPCEKSIRTKQYRAKLCVRKSFWGKIYMKQINESLNEKLKFFWWKITDLNILKKYTIVIDSRRVFSDFKNSECSHELWSAMNIPNCGVSGIFIKWLDEVLDKYFGNGRWTPKAKNISTSTDRSCILILYLHSTCMLDGLRNWIISQTII